jgi:hypothetical protein
MTINKLEEVSKIFGAAMGGDYKAQGIVKTLAKGEVVEANYSGLQEAISTSDLAKTFNFATRAAVTKQYADLPSTWTSFAKRESLPNFNVATFREFDFTDTVDLADNGGFVTAPASLPVVPELTEYPTFRFTTGKNQVKLNKRGARVPFSWEAVINDEWNFISQLPGQLAKFAKNTEELEAVGVLTSTTGPNAGTFNAQNGNVSSKNYTLSLDALSLAKTEVKNRKVNGSYLNVTRWALIVPTTMEETAKRILNLSKLTITQGNISYETNTNNSDVTLVVNDWLTKVDQSANAAKTWYLVPLNGTDGTRDSIIVAFLQGHEAPEFRQSGNTGLYLGGGTVPSLEGSLLNDDVEYRVRHVVTGAFLYPQALFSSTGVDGAAPSTQPAV